MNVPAARHHFAKWTRPIYHVDCGGVVSPGMGYIWVWGCDKCPRSWGEKQVLKFNLAELEMRFFVKMDEDRAQYTLVYKVDPVTKYRFASLVLSTEAHLHTKFY